MIIEKAAYLEFLNKHDSGDFGSQRLGQAFYNHFKLHRLSDQQLLESLYEADGRSALKIIDRIFNID